MELFAWKPEYSVSNPLIDSQHKGLFASINKLYEAMQTGKTDAQISSILKSLESYTVSHFNAEEALMKRVNYPDLEVHKAEHDRFVAEVKKQLNQLEAGKHSVSIELLRFLREWLTQHILKVDKQYVSHIGQ